MFDGRFSLAPNQAYGALPQVSNHVRTNKNQQTCDQPMRLFLTELLMFVPLHYCQEHGQVCSQARVENLLHPVRANNNNNNDNNNNNNTENEQRTQAIH